MESGERGIGQFSWWHPEYRNGLAYWPIYKSCFLLSSIILLNLSSFPLTLSLKKQYIAHHCPLQNNHSKPQLSELRGDLNASCTAINYRTYHHFWTKLKWCVISNCFVLFAKEGVEQLSLLLWKQSLTLPSGNKISARPLCMANSCL